MLKKLLTLLMLILLASLVLVACGGAEDEPVEQEEPATTAPADEPEAPEPADEPAPEPTDEPAPEPTEEPVVEGCAHKIGFVTDVGKLNDQSFNEAGWYGVLEAAAELGLAEECYGFIETVDSADYVPNMESFIDEGFNIIVTSGFAMGAATHETGKEYPDVFFVGTDQTQVDAEFNPEVVDNVAGLIFHEDVSGFLAGALAGLMTETNVVGGVYGCPFIPPVARFEVGYYNGAKYVNPDVEVLNVYHPGSLDVCFIDPEFAAETANTLIGEGADIMFGAGGLTGNGALIAACNQGLKVIGVDVDQYVTLPEVQDCIMSSATKGLTADTRDLILSAVNGTFKGGEFYGPAVLAPFHNFEDVIPQEVKDRLEEISAMVDAGEIDPCAPFEGSNEGTFCTPIVTD
jgi:basic membrane protein A